MTREEFEQIVEDEFPRAVPEKFHRLIENVAFLVEDEPDQETRVERNLAPHETLLGLYKGVPHTARGEGYGVGVTLPDTITLYQLPIEEEAAELEHESRHSHILQNVRMSYEEWVRKVVRETIWHEVAHYFGYDEHQVRNREDTRDTL
jgi:predicted Zn-dependent protease with MMP-like domain